MITNAAQVHYVCPETKQPLCETEQGLSRADGKIFPWLALSHVGNRIPNFLKGGVGDLGLKSLDAYHSVQAEEFYRNFLYWLFSTFEQDEAAFRKDLVSRLNLSSGSKVLVTGCGLGDDFLPILAKIGDQGRLYAQDLSPSMIFAAQRDVDAAGFEKNVFLSVGNAEALPFEDDLFDAAFHFGGINLFDNPRAAVEEMNRAVKTGGKVVFGDEGVAPWLRETEYGKIVIVNNPLWAREAPLTLLPASARDVHVTWVLGNCFYLIDYTVSTGTPRINMDIRHRGRRGGTMASRYFGQLEGVTVRTRQQAQAAADAAGLSVHEWLERAVLAALRAEQA